MDFDGARIDLFTPGDAEKTRTLFLDDDDDADIKQDTYVGECVYMHV
jgi:hypothetical protein